MTSTYSRIRATGTSLSDGSVTDAVNSQTTVDMAEGAARQAIDGGGFTPEDIDFLVIATTSPDVVFPNVGCLLQERLGMRGCAAFSVEAGSTGFIYALSIADKFVASGQARCALVIGADTLSGSSDAGHRETAADCTAAAGAVVLVSASEPGIVSSNLGADRRYKALLPAIAVSNQADNVQDQAPGVTDTGEFESAVDSLRQVVDKTLTRQKLSSDDVDWMIPQQTNLTTIQATARGLGISMQKVVVVPEYHGDMATAAIPVALDCAIRDGRISDGDLLLLAAVGGAVTWGSALIRL